MASLTIRNIDDKLKTRLRIRAASHGRSMEQELRVILRETLDEPTKNQKLGTLIHERFLSADSEDITLPPRDDYPEEMDFSE